MKTKLKVWAISASLVLLVAAMIGYHQYRAHVLYYHFRVVNPGKLYRSGTLSLAGLRAVYAKAHFKTIIVLRSKEEIKRNTKHWYTNERAFSKAHNVRVDYLYMRPDVPPSKVQLKRFLAITTDPKRQPILVHCAQGVVRTGMMVAVYRMAVMGQTNQYVLRHMTFFGHNRAHHLAAINFIKHYHLAG